MRLFWRVTVCTAAIAATGHAKAPGTMRVRVRKIADAASAQGIEIRGARAGPFQARYWEAGTLNWVPDTRSPLLPPREGKFQNIYAPSAVPTRAGWRLFYGAWDGLPTPNDRLYSADTLDFLTFANRHTVIEHGAFTHVCNVNVQRLADGSYRLMATAYPDSRGQNKPIVFSSPDGKSWNGAPEPYVARPDDLVTVDGYPNYENADINGMNVLLREASQYRMYFGDFHHFDGVYRASGVDGRHYRLDGKVLDGSYAVNDVKRLRSAGRDYYLMGLHMNGDRLWYSLSQDGAKFPAPHTLFTSRGPEERYIVALGWVVQGEPEKPGRSVLGVLYGAGADKGLATNRIFARWLQKRVEFVADRGMRITAIGALGPDRQIVPLADGAAQGHFDVYAEDGRTLIGNSAPLTIRSGEGYEIRLR